jgi:serine phosphatase RsbU (regulator of sigma subunit)
MGQITAEKTRDTQSAYGSQLGPSARDHSFVHLPTLGFIGVLRDTTQRRPAAVLDALNRAIAGQVDGGFVTCVCARFEIDGNATFANAGHLPPYLDGTEFNLDSHFPLGVVREIQYSETTVRIAPESVVTLVSDGVVEAMNARRELFGFDRTRQISKKQRR